MEDGAALLLWFAGILVAYGVAFLLFLISVRADRARARARYEALETLPRRAKPSPAPRLAAERVPGL